MKKLCGTLFAVVSLLIPYLAKGQQSDTVPYCCDFEQGSMAEVYAWYLENDATNEWSWGNATSNMSLNPSSMKCLYISNDNGTTHNFTGTVTHSYAYRRLYFPAGIYDISFDWVAKGYQSGTSYYSYMRVFLIPATITITGGSALTNLSATMLPANAVNVDGGPLCGKSAWQSFRNPYVQVGTAGYYYLVFYWYNNANGSNTYQPPAAVDDICINPVTCPQPRSLTKRRLGTTDCVELSWTDLGNPTGWIIEYGQRGFTHGTGTKIYTNSKPDTICSLAEDVTYEFVVRAVCDTTDTSDYSENIYVRYCSTIQGCIDYANLNDPNLTCTYGKYNNYNTINPSTANNSGPYATVGIRNRGGGHGNGSTAGASHTVMEDVTEKDSLTGFQLYTIPPDACKSVRLGCRYGSNLCQASAYRLQVDTSAVNIAIVNYAVVLVDPTNQHQLYAEPRFIFEILDANNNLISQTCGYSNINVSEARTSWNQGIQFAGTVYWKDWTPIGLDLSPYNGQTITIRITVFACGAGANNHSGYMYYTLECSKARILTRTCGNNTQEGMLTAPAGFRYRWYNPSKPGWTASTQTVSVDIDSSVYYCDVMFIDDTSCKFTVSAMAAPRFPHAKFSATLDTEGCRYTVNVNNSSYISISASSTDSVGTCTRYIWDWGDGTPPMITTQTGSRSHTYTRPGTYTIMLVAVYGTTESGECYDTAYYTVTFNAPVAPTISGDSVVCINTRAHIQVDGQTATRFQWSTGATTRGVDIYPPNPTTVSVSVWDQLGCKTDLTFHVDVDTVPLPQFSPEVYESCVPYTMSLVDINPESATNMYSWDWGDGSYTSRTNAPTHTYGDEGTYHFRCDIESAEGCYDTVYRTAYVYGFPHGSFSWTPPIITVTNPTVNFINLTNPNPTNTYAWEVFYHTSNPVSYSDFEPSHTWTGATTEFSGSNLVRLITTNQIRTQSGATVECADTVENAVLIINDMLQIPNTVTPNGDGINDIFEIKNLIDGGGYTDNELYIYNNWGRKVYHKKNISKREDFWDPAANNDPDGTYYYRFSAKGYLGNILRNGIIQVLR